MQDLAERCKAASVQGDVYETGPDYFVRWRSKVWGALISRRFAPSSNTRSITTFKQLIKVAEELIFQIHTSECDQADICEFLDEYTRDSPASTASVTLRNPGPKDCLLQHLKTCQEPSCYKGFRGEHSWIEHRHRGELRLDGGSPARPGTLQPKEDNHATFSIFMSIRKSSSPRRPIKVANTCRSGAGSLVTVPILALALPGAISNLTAAGALPELASRAALGALRRAGSGGARSGGARSGGRFQKFRKGGRFRRARSSGRLHKARHAGRVQNGRSCSRFRSARSSSRHPVGRR